MFKKTAIWILLLLYFGTANGMALNLHFCGEKLSKVQLSGKAIKSCCPGEEEEEDDCCHNKKLQVKLEDRHEAAAPIKLPAIKHISLFAIRPLVFTTAIPTDPFQAVNEIKPPPVAVPLSIRHCVFRI